MPMPRGKRAGSKTPTVDYAAGCLVRSTSTKCPTKKSRTSSSPPISRPENAWASRPLSRRSSKSLAKTCKSGSLSLLHLDLESRTCGCVGQVAVGCEDGDHDVASDTHAGPRGALEDFQCFVDNVIGALEPDF